MKDLQEDYIIGLLLDGSDFLGIGTHLKYYIEEGQTFNDITPVRKQQSAGELPFLHTQRINTITVIDPAHGANVNDFVTFSGAASARWTITAAVLNRSRASNLSLSSNSYTITSSVAANGSDTGNGGGSVLLDYQINTGLDVTVGGTGWGAGQWSGTTSGAATHNLTKP